MRALIYIALVMYLAVASCAKATGPADANSIQPDNNLDTLVGYSADINGALWKTDSVFGYFVKYSGNDSNKVNLEIIATQDSGQNASMTIILTNFTGANVYAINPPYNSITYYKGNTRFYASTGTVTVTYFNDTGTELTGTFNFTADTLTVTNGEFNVAQP